MRSKKSGKRKPSPAKAAHFPIVTGEGMLLVGPPHANNLVGGFRIAIKEAQPVVEWSPAPSGVETGCRMDWTDYLRDEAAKYRQLAKAAEDLSIKQELLDLAAVCEEAADNIEDRMPGG
jgi:hypothetical protein